LPVRAIQSINGKAEKLDYFAGESYFKMEENWLTAPMEEKGEGRGV